MIGQRFINIGEYAAAGMYEEQHRSLFYRKALGLRRYYENCELYLYSGELLYPSGTTVQKMCVVPYYYDGLFVNSRALGEKDPSLARMLRDEFSRYHSSVPTEHTVAGNMFTHSMPYYERVLKEGLHSYRERIGRIEDTDMREGLIHLVSGIECYVKRCVGYLESVGADRKLVDALGRVPMYPARNIYEAIVGWNFIMYLDGCDNLGSLGRGLMPYFKGEDVVKYLENLYDNLDKNNGYSMSLDADCPELCVQCLTAAKGKRRPMIELFVDTDTPKEIWDAAFELVKSGGGQPAFYNANVLFSGLKRRFRNIRDEDIVRFSGGGCTESMIPGLSNVGSLDAGINLLLILESTMKECLGMAVSFEELYGAYIKNVEDVVDKVKREISNSRIERAKYNPLPMRTLLVDDCIEKGVEYNSGGARYNWSIINFAGLINVIDSLWNIKRLVFDEKRYTGEGVLALLASGDADFLGAMIARSESFGKDQDNVNEFAREISSRIFSMTEGGTLAYGEGFISASIQFNSQASAGKKIGATPDGRSAGAPLCDSLAAIFGKDTLGPTALLGSVTSLDLAGALGTPVFNFNLSKKLDDGILKALILGYMAKGGVQMQITYASTEELLDAYEHPELHGNLIVRVGGYSEYFTRLTDDMQKMIINRSVHEL